MTYEVKTRKDLVDLINNGNIIPTIGLATIVLALGGTLIDAYDFGSIGIGVVQLESLLHLTATQVGFLTAAMAFGALFGALVGGRLIDSVGRLKMFLLDLVLFVIGSIGAALSINLPMLMGFRVLMGIGVGIDFPVSLSLIAEYSRLNSKGKNVNMWQSTWYIATVGVYAIAFGMFSNYAVFGLNIWRWVIGIGAIPAFIIILLRFKYMGESPLWTFVRGSKADIEKLLDKLGITDIKLPEKFAAASHPKAEYKMLFNPVYRKRTALSVTIAMEQSLEYFAVGFYLPVILLALFSGNYLLGIGATALLNIAGIVGGTSQSFLTQRVGLRKLAITGLVPVFLILLFLGIYGNTLSAIVASILLALFVFFHSFGQGSQGMTMGALSYPTSIRGAGAGFTQAMIRVGSIIGFFSFPLLEGMVGTYHAILYISIAPLISLIITLLIRWDPIKFGDVDEADKELIGDADISTVEGATGGS
ncbi:MAG: MFS transporter [Thermoplasmatales archaeon]|nr:MFS transporter [Thermoplasmatales archaeon]